MDNKIIALIIITLVIVIGGFYVFSAQSSADNLTINNTNNTIQLNPTHTNTVNTIKTTNNTNNTNQNS